VGQTIGTSVSSPVALPPLELARRVGHPDGNLDAFEELGRRARTEILEVLPEDWSFPGKRVLDFGCGSGRVLREFLPDAQVAEFLACDIHAESVAWVERTMSPPVQRVFRCEELPPLPLESASLDLILAISVFTHLADDWSAWLLELHRLLRPDGLLFATFLGSGMSEGLIGETWQEDRVGMNVLRYGQSFDFGGPIVFHSPWWIREHWGRAFEIVTLRGSGFASRDNPRLGHGFVLLRKRPVNTTCEEIELLRPDEPRELAALRHNIRQLHAESKLFRDYWESYSRGDPGPEVAHLRALVSGYETSRSWRLTRPLRKVHALLATRRRPRD
jgi:SAM-dependent methyltransferase